MPDAAPQSEKAVLVVLLIRERVSDDRGKHPSLHNHTIRDMEKLYTRHYGYLLNMRAVLRYALFKWPGIEETMESGPFDKWFRGIVREVVRVVGTENGIPDLGLRPVWLGNGYTSFCWSLPSRFSIASISKDPSLRKQIDSLKATLGEVGDPRYYFSFDDPEPEHIKKRNIGDEEADMFDIKFFLRMFDGDRKAVVKELMEEMEGLYKTDQDLSQSVERMSI